MYLLRGMQLCVKGIYMWVCPDCLSSPGEKRRRPAATLLSSSRPTTLEKQEDLDIRGLKRARRGLIELSSRATTQTKFKFKVARLRHSLSILIFGAYERVGTVVVRDVLFIVS